MVISPHPIPMPGPCADGLVGWGDIIRIDVDINVDMSLIINISIDAVDIAKKLVTGR